MHERTLSEPKKQRSPSDATVQIRIESTMTTIMALTLSCRPPMLVVWLCCRQEKLW